MKERNKLLKVLLAGVFLIAVSGISNAAEGPRHGGTLQVALDSAVSSLSAATTLMAAVIASGPIYDSLITLDKDFKPHPGLAKSWKISEDGLTYTFQLVNNASWHDGKPFTSEAVKFTIQEILAKYHPAGSVAWGMVERIETPDKYTVVFKVKKPTSLFMKVLGPYHCKIMPKHIYEGTDIMKNPANLKPIGTGPAPHRHQARLPDRLRAGLHEGPARQRRRLRPLRRAGRARLRGV